MSRAEQPESQVEVTVGRQLRIAREAAGIGAEEFAREANLTVRQVQAMETDEYNWFNGPVFIKGYIRVYAKRFGLNGDVLIRQFEQANPDEQPKVSASAPMRPQPLRPSHDFKFREPRQPGRWLKWLAGLVLLVGVIALAVWLQDSEWLKRQTGGANAVTSEQMELDQVSDLESGEAEMSLSTVVDGAPVQSSDANNIDVSVDSQAEQAQQALQQAIEPAAADAVTTPANSAQALDTNAVAAELAQTPSNAVADQSGSVVAGEPSGQVAEEDSERLLRLEFSDECWVQVKNAAGRVIHERIHKAGDAIDLDIVPPVQLWFGRARAVNVTYNGTAVALPLKAGTNSVKFTFTDAQGQSTLE